MTPGEWIALVSLGVTVLLLALGGVVWALRLEGRQAQTATVIELARAAQDRGAAIGTAVEVLRGSVARLERDADAARELIERLARLEGAVEAIRRAVHAD